jgi:hypothetical protein
MNSVATLRKTFATSPLLAAVAYAGLVFVLLFTVIISIAGIFGQRAEVASSAAMLEQLEGRRPAAARRQSADAPMPAGSCSGGRRSPSQGAPYPARRRRGDEIQRNRLVSQVG